MYYCSDLLEYGYEQNRWLELIIIQQVSVVSEYDYNAWSSFGIWYIGRYVINPGHFNMDVL